MEASHGNPASYISESMCPILVQHGTMDKFVPYQQSVEFVEAVKEKAGREKAEFVPIEGAGHGDKRFITKENMELIFDFLNRRLFSRQE